MRFKQQLGVGIVACGLAAAWAGSATGQAKPRAEPAPRAAAAEQQRAGLDPHRILVKLEAAIEEMDLTEQQRPKLRAIVEKARADLKTAMQPVQGEKPAQRLAKIRQGMQPLRDEVFAVLDEPQREALRIKMAQAGVPPVMFGRPAAATTRPATAARPSTAPSKSQSPPQPRNAMASLQHLKASLSKLKLSSFQKQQADAVLGQTPQRLSELEAEAAKAVKSSRERLEAILTIDQKEKLNQMLPASSE